MLNKTITKVAALSLGMTLALGVSTAGAQTIAELQAQINALMAQLAALQGGSTTPTTGQYNFTQNLTIGSTGGDVVSLQQYLVGAGHLNMPVGVSYGYFGPLTRAAVAKWQAANGVAPAVGYWGPISRARFVSMSPGTPGTPGTPTTPGTGITTPGVEGTITVSVNPTPAAGVKVYENDSKVEALGIKLEAKTSDIRIERIKIELPSVQFYNEIANRIYVMDGSNVVASADLNSSTVVNESGTRSITLSGMNYVVPKDATRVLTVALDIYSNIDSTLTDGDTFTLTIPVDGVRGVDGAGINQFGPSTGNSFSRAITPTADLVDSATLAVSTSANSPLAKEVIAATGANEDEVLGLELLRFDLRSTRDDVTVTDAVVTLDHTGNASSTVVYLYDGNTLVGSASPSSGASATATFSDIDYVVPKDSTKTLRVVVDADDADATASTIIASVAATTGITAEKSDGTALAETGSATGQTVTLLNVGPEISLSSTPSLVRDAGTIGLAGGTSTASATFNVTIKAVGGDLWFGTQSASSTFGFGIHTGGADAATVLTASTTGFTVPSGANTTDLATGQSFKLSENQSVTVPVTFFFNGRLASGALLTTNSYAVGLSSVGWSDSKLGPVHTSTFMANKSEWRTNGVTMP